MLPLILLVILTPLLIYYIHSIQTSTRGLPPGPFVVPILGSYLALWLRKPTFKIWEIAPWEHVDRLSKEFGEMFALSIFHFNVVLLCSHEILTEVANMEEYSEKISHKLLTYPRTFGKELGILAVSSPPIWTEMRKFTVRTLREFGFGKEYTMHGVITSEANLLVEDFKLRMKLNKGILTSRSTFTLSVLNVLWSMVAGVRYDHNDPTLLKLTDAVFRTSKSLTMVNPLELLKPFLSSMIQKFLKMDVRYKMFEECHTLSASLINERKSQGFYLTQPENYIDVFLQKIHYNKHVTDTVYTMEQLQSMIEDLLVVGTLTVDSTLEYALYFLTLNPEVQRKCQEEIDAVVGKNNSPTEDDVAKMPFFQAFLLELHRCANVVPNPIPRLVPKDWHFRGYRIPKGSIVVANHYTINKDVRIWKDPEIFRPSRFINEKGEFTPDSRVTVFGFGKRICIGVNFVNSVLPLFIATLLQKFTFSVVRGSGGSPPSSEPDLGCTLSPKIFQAQICLREIEDNILTSPHDVSLLPRCL